MLQKRDSTTNSHEMWRAILDNFKSAKRTNHQWEKRIQITRIRYVNELERSGMK